MYETFCLRNIGRISMIYLKWNIWWAYGLLKIITDFMSRTTSWFTFNSYRYNATMITHFFCSASNTGIEKVCIQASCKHTPFMCDRKHCSCLEDHRSHTSMEFKSLMTYCKTASPRNETVSKGLKAMTALLGQLANVAVALEAEHTRLSNDRILAERHELTLNHLASDNGKHPFTGD